jgi:hypothetical protein
MMRGPYTLSERFDNWLISDRFDGDIIFGTVIFCGVGLVLTILGTILLS